MQVDHDLDGPGIAGALGFETARESNDGLIQAGGSCGGQPYDEVRHACRFDPFLRPARSVGDPARPLCDEIFKLARRDCVGRGAALGVIDEPRHVDVGQLMNGTPTAFTLRGLHAVLFDEAVPLELT